MKLIIAGDRNFEDFERLHDAARWMEREYGIDAVVCGMARGADLLGKKFAELIGVPVLEFPADWDKHGKAAGPIRNEQMAQEGTALLAFLAEGSKGTKHMINTALRHCLSPIVVECV